MDKPDLFTRIKSGLEEGIQFARGELNLRTTEIPEKPPVLDGSDIVRMRRKFQMSQGVFARLLNVSTKTIQSWEQAERRPSQAALRLLQILEAKPAMVCQILGVRLGKSRKKTG